ncbi:MAG: hypothetical protein Q9208_004954 [Pyrenodesmia sp. 3 TL-2023]
MGFQPAYNPGRLPLAAATEDLYAVSSLTQVCTPDSFNMGSSHLQSCQSPETADPADLWSSAFNFGNLNDQQIASEDFGLGLGALGSDPASTTFKVGETDSFPYPSLPAEFETLHFDPGSPDGQSWSSLSEASAGLSSDMADFSPESDGSGLDPGLAADLDAFLQSADSTPSLSHYPSTRNYANHYRAESAPRHPYRTSPYPMNFGRGRSASTSSAALARTRRASTFFQTVQQTPDMVSQLSSPCTETDTVATFEGNEFQMYCQSNQLYVSGARFERSSETMSICGTNVFEQQPQPLAEMPNILQSSGHNNHLCEHHFAGSTSPPDLFGPLSEEPSSPPPEDFDVEESMMPRAQDLRFEGDMYTPRWLVLKNSAFWYDKSFSHGISAATGSPFEGPRETRRMKGNPDVWEGLCGSCNGWIALISSKKKGTTWFRHAYKCHTHQKVKDTTKRRREVALGRVVKAPKTKTVKSESRDDTPFSIGSGVTPLHEASQMQSDDWDDARSGAPMTT